MRWAALYLGERIPEYQRVPPPAGKKGESGEATEPPKEQKVSSNPHPILPSIAAKPPPGGAPITRPAMETREERPERREETSRRKLGRHQEDWAKTSNGWTGKGKGREDGRGKNSSGEGDDSSWPYVEYDREEYPVWSIDPSRKETERIPRK